MQKGTGETAVETSGYVRRNWSPSGSSPWELGDDDEDDDNNVIQKQPIIQKIFVSD
jgi:hypothetical protein